MIKFHKALRLTCRLEAELVSVPVNPPTSVTFAEHGQWRKIAAARARKTLNRLRVGMGDQYPELVAELERGLVSRGIAGCDIDKMLVSHLRWIMWELKKLGLDGGAKFTVVRAETWLSERPD